MPFNSRPMLPVAHCDPPEYTPNSARTFLLERNWQQTQIDPRNGDQLFEHNSHGGMYRWYEAVAMETIGLLRIGHD